MVVPAVAMAADVIKGLGEAARESIFTFRYVGKSKWWQSHIPDGMVITLPAWFVAFLIIVGGVALLMIFLDAVMKGLEKLGIGGSKGGLLGGGGGSDVLDAIWRTTPLGALGKGTGWW